LSFAPFVTSSGVDRFMACTGSAHLIRVSEDRGAAAIAGIDEHAVRLQPGQLPRKVLDWFGGADPMYEVAMATDCDDVTMDAARIGAAAALFVGQYIERGYPAMPGAHWLAGTADMVQVAGDVVSVADLKTGRGQARGSLPLPQDAGQLLSLAWMATRLRQLKTAERRVLPGRRIILSPTWRPARIRLAWWLTAERPDDIDDAEIGYDELMDWATKFCDAVQRSSASRLHRGPQCSGCSAFDACPAQGGAIRRVLEVSTKMARPGINDADVLSDDEIAAAYLDLEVAERACEAARAALKRRIEDRGEVLVGEKHRLKIIKGTDTQISAAVAAEVLGDKFAECATIRVSQAGLVRGLGTQDIGPVMDSIRERGGLVTVPKAGYLKVVKR